MRKLFISIFLMTCFMTAALFGHTQSAPKHKDRYYYESRGEIVWEVPTEDNIIALTFDDGPDPEDTPAILDLLKQYDAKATFFVIGKHAEMYPELVKRESREGHEIANHTYNHCYFNNKVTKEKIRDEIMKAEQLIVSITGKQPNLFRPPGGYYNDNVVHVSETAGYQVVLWSWHQDTEDWSTPGVGKIVNKVLRNARNGDIILFHDNVDGKTQTIAALKQILPRLKERGFRFVTVSELLAHRKSTPVKK